MQFPRLPTPADRLARPMDKPTYWRRKSGDAAKAVTIRDELTLREENAQRLQLWEYEAILIADEIGSERPRMFGSRL